ncbi:MAG TPA: LEPR-XLL domain-containing protein, partial [Opitutaceae bacterium]|nr:LEPR-XLL domain-containing protein [Opitutaceae bacterium]
MKPRGPSPASETDGAFMLEPLESRILLSAADPSAGSFDTPVDEDRLVSGEVIQFQPHAERAVGEGDDQGIFGDIEGSAPLTVDAGDVAAGEGRPTTANAAEMASPGDEYSPESEAALVNSTVASVESNSARMIETLNAGQGPPASDPVVANETTEATMTWLGGSGEWNVGANWSGGIAPGAGDTAVVSSGTVTISQGVVVSVAGFTFSGGTLNGAGQLNITGLITWTGGSMAGTGTTRIEAGGTYSFEGTNTRFL